ncbi:hypothetical protein ART_3352 [Arthrobacter sp. PAMC 25486]|uniref:hypothetical protein n=1 Tax=Arthrobacter sp. PAMC 25486 TaxID=1494608 RepID=UPI000535F309|nr:hypothetical protein [Arthrobacter sp. PAMC 25486]AIY02951.1 hypothetical protein ART_3352 [Arthrobacter sp. PAMC 25486]
MKRQFSFDPDTLSHLADNIVLFFNDARRIVAAAKGFATEIRDICYVVSPPLE